MQFTTILASSILAFASGIAALPQAGSNQITLTIFNDQTGARGAASVVADGVARKVPDLFKGTAIDSNGNIIGTSAQLTKFTDSTKCTLNNGGWVIQLDGRAKNFVDLDGNPNKAVPVWLNNFTFQCTVA